MGLPMQNRRRLVLWRWRTSWILWWQLSNLCHSHALTLASTQIDQRTTRKVTTRTSSITEGFSQSSCHQTLGSSGQNCKVSPSSKPVKNSDEDVNNEEFSHHHLLVCTCPPIAKPQAAAAKTAKCCQAEKLESSDEDANNEELGKSNCIQCGNIAWVW